MSRPSFKTRSGTRRSQRRMGKGGATLAARCGSGASNTRRAKKRSHRRFSRWIVRWRVPPALGGGRCPAQPLRADQTGGIESARRELPFGCFASSVKSDHPLCGRSLDPGPRRRRNARKTPYECRSPAVANRANGASRRDAPRSLASPRPRQCAGAGPRTRTRSIRPG